MENGKAMELAIPQDVFGVEISEGEKVAGLFKAVMAKKEKKILFNGKEYAEFPDWQLISNYYGLTIRTHSAVPVDINGTKGFKAQADLVSKDGIVVGGAEAYCLQDEPNWARKPLFQLASMAQTRASSKAISNRYRWVVAIAGYGTTPAEEMQGVESYNQAPPQRQLPPRSNPVGAEQTIQPMTIEEKTSKKGNTYWTVQDTEGVKYFTYSKKVANDLMGAKESDSAILCHVTSDGKSNQIVEA